MTLMLMLCTESITILGYTSVLVQPSPTYSVVERLPGELVPHDGGLALVGDPDGLDVGRVEVQVAQVLHGLVDTLLHRGQDLLRVLLHPAVRNEERTSQSFYVFISEHKSEKHSGVPMLQYFVYGI